MKAKQIKLIDADYNFLIDSFILEDGQTFDFRMPKGYHIVRARGNESSETIFLSKEQ